VIDFCGIPLAHRIVNGSGTFDAIAARRAFGDALLDHFPFAAFVSKTVTLEPRQGNPPPRLWELPGGLINSIGLPNKGLDGYLREDLPQLAELPVPLIVNVMGSTPADVARLVTAFGERDEVAAIELNVSCPNVKTGLIMGADPRELAGLLDHVRPRTDKPLIVKLTPNCTSPADVAAAAEAHGADAVSLINTLRGMAFDPRRPGVPWLGGETGGVPGPAVRAVAVAQVAEVRGRVAIPIVGMGGVQTGRHAHDLLQAGADVIAVGTESFRDPMAGARVAAELAESLANSGIAPRARTLEREPIAHNA
jgi:dihydroorotate dehydrogenase (NAD+) catalytic subunit